MQTNNLPYCLAPWVNIQHGNTMEGTTPCCEWNGPKFKGDLGDYNNGEYLNNIKKMMLDKNMDFINNTCSECINMEKVGISSRRLKLFDDPVVQENSNNLLFFDYRPSNLCNLKCSMCNEFASSMIAKEKKIEIKQDYIRDGDYKKLDLQNLFQIMIAGGEPSIQQEVYDFLNYCIEIGIHNTCHLQFTTNATNCNTKWMSMLEKWKSKSVEISLDGTGKTFEYVRTHSNWKSVEKNCEHYERIFDEVTYHITALAYNIPNVEDWIEWFMDKEDVNIYPVDANDHLTLDVIPDRIKIKKINYLKQFDKPFVKTLIAMLENSRYNHRLVSDLVEKTREQQFLRKGDIYSINKIYKEVIPGL